MVGNRFVGVSCVGYFDSWCRSLPKKCGAANRQGSKERVQALIDFGVEFDRREDASDGYDLHKEGGHSARRILHSKDLTGAEIMRALHAKADELTDLEIIEDRMAIDLITEGSLARRSGELPPVDDRVVGAYVLDTCSGKVETWAAKVVVLCTEPARFTFTPN